MKTLSFQRLTITKNMLVLERKESRQKKKKKDEGVERGSYQLCAVWIMNVIYKDSFYSISEYLIWLECMYMCVVCQRTAEGNLLLGGCRQKIVSLWEHRCHEQTVAWKHGLGNLKILRRVLWTLPDHGAKLWGQFYLDFWGEYFTNVLVTHLQANPETCQRGSSSRNNKFFPSAPC